MDIEDQNLGLVLAPLSHADFINDYWEKNPLHISRNSESHFAPLLSAKALETMLSTQALHFPSVQLTQSGQHIDISDYTDDARRILPHPLIEKHRNGATIVVSQAHEKIPSLASFRRAMQNALNLKCQTNVYLSPTGKQGFNAHYDSHDVFILQVAGTKTFNFYDGGIDLPYSHDGFNADSHEVGDLSMSIEMQPGDTLYIPRGVLHDAIATEQTSLHITLGVYAITLRDVMLELTQQLTAENPLYRQSVPNDFISHQDFTAIDESIKDSFSVAFSEENIRKAITAIQDSHAIDSSPNCDGMLTMSTEPNVSPSDELDSTSKPAIEKLESKVIQFKQNNLLGIERSNNTLRLRTHGQVLEFSPPFIAAIDLLLTHTTQSILDLPSLDDNEKSVLIEKLASANLLTFAPN